VEGSAKVVVRPSLPASYVLSQNYPNPFNPSTTIGYALPEESMVRLRVYDLRGGLVRTLRDRITEAGYYQATWDGRDDRGIEVSSGVYVYRLEARTGTNRLVFARTRKMLLIK